MLTVEQVLGVRGADVVLEGRQIVEFLMLLRGRHPKWDYERLERAVRITGKEVGKIKGGRGLRAFGRRWVGEYDE